MANVANGGRAGRLGPGRLLIGLILACALTPGARAEREGPGTGGFIDVDDLPKDAAVTTVPCPVRLRLRLPPRYEVRVWSSGKTAAVACDGVSMPRLEIVFRELRNGTGWLGVKPEFDLGGAGERAVRLDLAVEVAGERVATTSRGGIGAEAGRKGKSALELAVPPEILRTWRLGTVAFLEIVFEPNGE